MATLIDADRVNYMCSCKRLKPLCYLYYCKYCKPFTLKCKECVLHEVDQKYFCTYCFDHKVHKEVVQLKFKCSTCYSCPCCKNSLITRASTLKPNNSAASNSGNKSGSLPPAESPLTQHQVVSTNTPSAASDASMTPTTASTTSPPSNTPTSIKVYYLICGFCRWTSRDVGIPDALTTPVNLKSKENPHEFRISELLSAYKVVATREKLEKEKKKYPLTKRRVFHQNVSSSQMASASSLGQHGDKYGILTPVFKHLSGGGSTSSSAAQQTTDSQPVSIEQQFKSLVKPAITVETFDDLPNDLFTQNIKLNSLTTIAQRHSSSEFQPIKSNELFPLNKFYISKESKRCNGCEHNVIKPESNITSIKFKLHQMALFMIPEIRIVTVPNWKLNEPNEVILSVTNRCESDLNISFVPLSEDETNTMDTDPSREDLSIRNISGFYPTAKIEFKQQDANTILTIEKQDSNSKSQTSCLKPTDLSTNGFVCFRRENKIGIICSVTPIVKQQSDKKNLNVKAAFGLRHYLNETNQSGETITNSIIQKIFIDFGPIRSEDGLKVILRPKYIEDWLNSQAGQTPTKQQVK